MPHCLKAIDRLRFLALFICLAGLLSASTALAQSDTGERNLLDDGRDTQTNSLQNALETFVLDRVGPAGDVITLMKAAPATIRAAKILQLKRKKTEAYQKGEFDKGDRYDALLECWQFGNCKKASRMQAASRRKNTQGTAPAPSAKPAKGQIKTPVQPPPNPCASGQAWCGPGAYGSGGCYSIRAQSCTAGLICRRSSYACKVSNEPAYCQQGYQPCRSKKQRCSPPLKWCPPGPNGKGRCYAPNEMCAQGLICPKGSCICKLKGESPYCAPCGTMCTSKRIPPSPCAPGQVYCPAGSYGKGGCIIPAQTCIKGLVCPRGSYFCKLPGEPAYCARPGTTCQSRLKPQTPPPPPSRCRPPQIWCPAGVYGPGRCYLPGAQSCSNGTVCRTGYKACKRPGRQVMCIPANQPCHVQPLPPRPPVIQPPVMQPPAVQPPSRCRPPRIWCPPGAYDAGGCYLPGAQRCIRGLLCSAGFKACKRPGQKAFCIPAGQTCLIPQAPVQPPAVQPPSRCRPPQIWCPSGANGSGRCYIPGAQRCDRGMVCSAGFKVCKIAGQRPRCIPANGLCLSPVRPPVVNTPLQNFHRTAPSSRHDPRSSRAKTGNAGPVSRCPPPRRFCNAGGFGRGGCFLPARQMCRQGMICPKGMRPCKPSGERPRCIPGRARCLPSTGLPPGIPKVKPKPKPPISKPPGGGVHDSFGSKFGSKTIRLK